MLADSLQLNKDYSAYFFSSRVYLRFPTPRGYRKCFRSLTVGHKFLVQGRSTAPKQIRIGFSALKMCTSSNGVAVSIAAWDFLLT